MGRIDLEFEVLGTFCFESGGQEYCLILLLQKMDSLEHIGNVMGKQSNDWVSKTCLLFSKRSMQEACIYPFVKLFTILCKTEHWILVIINTQRIPINLYYFSSNPINLYCFSSLQLCTSFWLIRRCLSYKIGRILQIYWNQLLSILILPNAPWKFILPKVQTYKYLTVWFVWFLRTN